VRDDKAGVFAHEFLKCLLDQLLGFVIDAGSGLVEEQDGRIFKNDTSDGDALFLSYGKFYPAFPDLGVETC